MSCNVWLKFFERLSIFEGIGLLSSFFIDFVEGISLKIVIDYLAESAHNKFIYKQGTNAWV